MQHVTLRLGSFCMQKRAFNNAHPCAQQHKDCSLCWLMQLASCRLCREIDMQTDASQLMLQLQPQPRMPVVIMLIVSSTWTVHICRCTISVRPWHGPTSHLYCAFGERATGRSQPEGQICISTICLCLSHAAGLQLPKQHVGLQLHLNP